MDFKALFSQLSVVYAKLTKQQKAIIAFAIFGIVAFLVFLVTYTSRSSTLSTYEVLFDSLSSSDAAKVIEQLEKDKIPYKLENDNIIKVPKDVVYKERISIASLGIPKDNVVGFELFDTQEFGATKFDQDVKYLRALEGELSRTISALAPIKNASVSLALPKDTLFVAKQAEPTASVMIELNDARTLSNKQIRGIKNLVASAIPKLTAQNVMVISSEGVTLGDNDEMGAMDELSAVQQRYKTKEEAKLRNKIVEVVAPFVGGTDKVVAQVSVDYDFSIQSSTSEKYDPENVVRSEQVSEEKREGASPEAVGGVPGTVSNIGPVEGLASNKTSEKYSKNTGTTNYEVGKTVSTVKSQFARIKRITAAVLVDGKYKYKLDDAGNVTDETEYSPLDEADINALTSLASRSIGIDQDRGDLISVQNLQFEREAADPAATQVTEVMQFAQLYLSPFADLFKYIFVLLLLFILYKKAIVPFADKMLEVSKEEDELQKPALDLGDDEGDDLVEKVQTMRKKVEEQLGMSGTLNEDELKHEVLLEKVRVMAEDAPENIAALLQALLSEEAELPSHRQG
ncbi:MAG: flagellar M-ring protein FliF [Campylobacterales bacterium]|nr:flagellar M-ring protein FliF [Campylobacterales bacterium]